MGQGCASGWPEFRRLLRLRGRERASGQSGEAHVFLTQDNNLTAKVPLRRSILQCNLQQKYRLMGKHNPQRDDGPEKGLYRLHPIALRENRYARQTFKFRRPISCIAPVLMRPEPTVYRIPIMY